MIEVFVGFGLVDVFTLHRCLLNTLASFVCAANYCFNHDFKPKYREMSLGHLGIKIQLEAVTVIN